ncbi:hypothetical protein CMT41_00545 [Colwellia sp. MT41]|uniref:ECF-type sigma factor n=1 Tax=Colwellia sp. MT41 TaxID=58049 RepID=UPI00071779DB|nr:ECF-type sigma factor [Colwellia sp. MT41]ALO33364.1 hypothetical protein CMT41_00545 [Colwellia sp. MT41]
MPTLNKVPTTDFTQVLNVWVTQGDVTSANQLKSMIYYHLKGIVKNQIRTKAKKIGNTQLLEQLPNTTSLLHDVFIALVPPKEIFTNREQFYLSLALFVRWMLLDELKAKNAQKRVLKKENILALVNMEVESDPYFSFDLALSNLEKLLPRCYEIALLHYFLGFNVAEISSKLTLEKSTIYNELATAKAYLRTQYQAA